MRRAPPTRSTSFLGTLKSLVRPLATWLGSQEETEDDAQGKRRMVAQEIQDDEFGNTVQHRHKRKRIDSPEPHQEEADQLPPLQQNKFNQVQGGYLDPSSGLFNPPQSAQPGAAAHGRSSSLAVPSTSRPSFRLGRHSFSPQPTASYGRLDTMVRTQSMDPPRRNDATVVSIPLSRDASMSGIPPSPIHESSLSPSRTRFRMRTSLTPQPSGQSFGPTPVRRERNPSEPPPLEALMAHPIFVRPPESQPEPIQREQSLTLGNLVEARRAVSFLSDAMYKIFIISS
ncbi:hypothetical protein C8Q75DRAFT_17296 [Abortiporus biennis]|nr:hypothetical protein C8Q75DRAFT_17296 [Abortiporus biennis]